MEVPLLMSFHFLLKIRSVKIEEYILVYSNLEKEKWKKTVLVLQHPTCTRESVDHRPSTNTSIMTLKEYSKAQLVIFKIPKVFDTNRSRGTTFQVYSTQIRYLCVPTKSDPGIFSTPLHFKLIDKHRFLSFDNVLTTSLK